MLAREPNLFLKAVDEAFLARTKPETIPRQNYHLFYAAKSAAIARLVAVDRIIPEFAQLSKTEHTMQRTLEEDQLLYGFFTNAVSAIDSFCFGAYFLGTALTASDFKQEPKLQHINPEKTLACFKNYCADSPFTAALQKCICSEQYTTTSAVRNVLSHRSSPTRAIHFTNRPVAIPNSRNLDLWFEGKVSKKELSLEPRTLVDLREWLEQQLELLGKELESLAAFHDLR
jgi:hypothetical protein